MRRALVVIPTHIISDVYLGMVRPDLVLFTAMASSTPVSFMAERHTQSKVCACLCTQVFAMEGGIFYSDSSGMNTDVTSSVVIVFGSMLTVIGAGLALIA